MHVATGRFKMSRIDELQKDAEELRKFLDVAERQKVKDIISIELRKIETEISNKIAKDKEQTEPSVKSTSTPKTVTPHTPTTELRNYGWDQSDNFMKLYVTVKGVETVPRENVTCDFTDRTISLQCREVNKRNHVLQVTNLAEDIAPADSYFKIKTDTVLVMLKKKEVKKKWECVTSTEKKLKEKQNKKPAYDDTKDPSEGLMGMLKQMYDDGDDNMKQTLAKAWTESREKKGADMF